MSEQPRIGARRKTHRTPFLLLAALLLAPPMAGAAEEEARPSTGQPDARPPSLARSDGAAPDPAASFHLDDLVVEADRDDALQPGLSVRKIARDEVEAPLSRSVAEALEEDASVFRFRNARGEQGILLRGFEQRQLLILLDGVPLYNAYDRVLDLGRIPLGPADHITLVKGAGSVAYGPNGLGGAVNITTRRPGEGALAEAEAAFAPEDERFRFRMGSDQKIGPAAYHVEFGALSDDGFLLSRRFDGAPNEPGGRRENSDATDFHVSGKVAWDPSPAHRVHAGGFYVKSARGVPPHAYTVNPRYWRWTDWEDLSLHAGHGGRYGAFTLEETLYANLNRNQLDSYDDDAYSTQTTPRAFRSRHEDLTLGATLRPALELEDLPGLGRTTVRAWLGGRYDRHDETPDVGLAESTFAVYTITLAPEVEMAPWKRLSVLLGLQADVELPERIEGFDPESNTHVGPMAQLVLRPADALSFTLQANRRARFPTLKERYSSTLGGRLPNPFLAPEKAWNLGLDARYGRGPLRVTAGGFYSDVSDLIVETVPPGGGQRIDNQGKVRYMGAETLVEWTPLEGLLLAAEYAFLHWERRETAVVDRLPYRPAHKGIVRARYTWRVLTLSSRLRAVSGQDFQDLDTGRWGRLGAYAVWDATIRYRPFDRLSLWASVQNILDANYQTAYGFPEPGGTLWIGARAALP